MTLTRNFPGRKYTRRIRALARLEKQIEVMETMFEGVNPVRLGINIRRANKEAEVLRERSRGTSGKVFTKKVGANTGGKWGIR